MPCSTKSVPLQEHGQLQERIVDDFSGVDANGVANICTDVPPWLRPKAKHNDKVEKKDNDDKVDKKATK